MKHLFAALFVLPILFACANTSTNKEEIEITEQATVAIDTVSYTGSVIDGAMNSVFIKTSTGDSLSFGYPELDRDKIQRYMVEDTITVNTVADTVVSIINRTNKQLN